MQRVEEGEVPPMKMSEGTLRGICIRPPRPEGARWTPMLSLDEVMAIEGQGLQGDRYATGEGSYNRDKPGNRQVSIMHMRAFDGQNAYVPADTGRNLFFGGDRIEFAWLASKNHEFDVGDARFGFSGYCDPCDVPTRYAGRSHDQSFRKMFWERGGFLCKVIRTGRIWVGCKIIAPDKGR
ncbi:MAG: hypothetical protein WA021_05065 [Minisyncoccia bacterium]